MDYSVLFPNSDSFKSQLMSSIYGCLIICFCVCLYLDAYDLGPHAPGLLMQNAVGIPIQYLFVLPVHRRVG